MPSWPMALGGMFAAGYAATQAQKVGIDAPVLVANALKSLGADTGYNPSPSGRPAGGSELTVLQGEVDRLHKLLADVVRGQRSGGGSGYTVIHTGAGRGGWTWIVLPVAAAGGVGYLYMRIRGISVADFFVVTNRSLQTFRELVSHSMTQLWEEMRKQKDEFLARIGALGQQQQQMMAQQAVMDEKLSTVSTNVEDIREISSSIEDRVGQMDHSLNIMSAGVQRANEGIYLLCAAVAEVTRRVGMDNSRLRTYVAAAPEVEANPGLRQLLDNLNDPTPLGGTAAALPAATSVGAGAAPPPTIVELPSEGFDGEAVLPSSVSPAPSMSRSRTASMDTALLYRRDSSRAESGRSIFGGLGSVLSVGTGAGGVSGNGRARAVAPA